MAACFGEDGDNTALRRHVQQAAAHIEVEHIRRLADLLRLQDLHRLEVEDEQLVVQVAGDEGKPTRWVEMEAVVVIAAREHDRADDTQALRVDYGDVVALTDIDERPSHDGIVLNVACVATEKNQFPSPA